MPIFIPIDGGKKVKTLYGLDARKISGVFGNVEGNVARMFEENNTPNGRFIAVAYNDNLACYSLDGKTWNAMDIPITYPRGITHGGDRYVICNAEKSCYSLDGETWFAGNNFPSAGAIGVCYFDGKFISFGGNYANISSDGETWTQSSRYGIGAFACSDKGIVAIDYEDSYYSTDGKTWIAMSGLPDVKFSAATYGKDRFITVGNKGNSYYSTDGKTWIAMSGLPTNVNFSNVTYGKDRFITVGNNNFYYSTDGETWVLGGTLTTGKITYGNDRFVCVCKKGEAYYSLDGMNWVAMNVPNTSWGYDCVFYG